MEKVKFKQMKEGSKEDYLLLNKLEKKFIEGTADRVLKTMQGLTSSLVGYQINRLEHSLQTATRALKEKASDEMIVAFAPNSIIFFDGGLHYLRYGNLFL